MVSEVATASPRATSPRQGSTEASATTTTTASVKESTFTRAAISRLEAWWTSGGGLAAAGAVSGACRAGRYHDTW
jgi:hypothetical protein